MLFRYDDDYKEFTEEELKQHNFIDNSIMELINIVNPSPENIEYDDYIVEKVRITLIDIFSKDLQLCTEKAFYP